MIIPISSFLDEKHIFAIEEIIYSMEKYIAKIELLANKLSEANYKLNEEKMVKKAKIILMKHKLSEDEAYKTIFKKIAMDLRISKLEAAKKILEKYDEKNNLR
ncbi:MAG: ANTAR domain-containing protein [Clostridium sp.]|nr:MAG: ANTAR domain-containing protein [Clostridium sp.]